MSVRCTWRSPNKQRCANRATHPQFGQDKSKPWADLCEEHHKMLDEAVGRDAGKMLAYWVCAQGGAKAAADRMTGGRKA